MPAPEELLSLLDQAVAAAAGPAPDLTSLTREVTEVDRLLHGVPGVQVLAGRDELVAGITARLDRLDAAAGAAERALEQASGLGADVIEQRSSERIALRDALWAVRHDRLRTAREVAALAGSACGAAALAGYLSVQQALSALDRLEVRGRDSAGVHLYVHGHGLQPDDPAVVALLAGRDHDPLFQGGSVRLVVGAGGRLVLSLVYKAAAEIGELGDNTRVLRRAIAADGLLRLALASPTAELSLVGHTRWASVGIISEPNAHPVNSDELGPTGIGALPYVVGALNGDVDNHSDLKVEHELRIAAPITTDAKVIPALVVRNLPAANGDLTEAFRRSVASFEGSVAIAAAAASDPSCLLLAQRGSGQALYVGLAEDAFVVASEPYGLVEETPHYVRMDGETPVSADRPQSRGQVFVLDAARAGEIGGVRRLAYDGTELPFTDADLAVAEVTTRDIDRGEFPHYLLKEITESPESLRKTIRGKIAEHDGRLRAAVGERALPEVVRARLAGGRIRRIRVVGQGTAAVAGRSMAAVLDELIGGEIDVDAITATELSGFALQLDMSDTLVVAVSQSGTTTDTNRTVDLARGRGALVLGIVNRRNSDLCDKAHGVLFTSDGRDVEMSVASTKAFYAQVAAGVLLACAISEAAGLGSEQRRHELLTALRSMPDAMVATLGRRDAIAEAARRNAPHKRYWAVVGNGPNTIAAHEVRIKLSELCYKSIACDVTEDKKHIDLSSEPLILVCAAGLVGSTADDVGKEIAIYRAHKATPIVIADEGNARFGAAAELLTVPAVDPTLAFLLSAMVGHLFGYEAALAIDSLAHPLRMAREAIERRLGTASEMPADLDGLLIGLRSELAAPLERFHDGLRDGAYDGHLEASTAVGLTALARDLASDRPLESYQLASGKVGTPTALLDDLTTALTRAIEQLTRPIDAIKHQAKTVTVGISRSDEGVLDRALVQEVLAAGAGRDLLTYRTLRVLADLDPAVDAVTGFTRYAIGGDPGKAGSTIRIVDRGGLAREVPSRVERNATLVGTKRRVASEREVLVARGRSDGRIVILVPEVKGAECVGITLLHVRLHDRLAPATMRGVLQGYDRRYDRLFDWVTETEGTFRDDLLGELPVVDLLVEPISEMADHWCS